MKVLLLGGNGFMGPHVVKAIENEHELRITDIMPIDSKHETRVVDVSDLDQVLSAAEGMDAIINLSVLRQDRKLAFDVSTRGTYNALQAAIEHGIDRFINTGPHFTLSGPTYLNFDFDISPDIPPHSGTGLYPITKSLGQRLCKIFSENHEISIQTYLFVTFKDHDDASEGTDLNPFTVSWRECGEVFRLGLRVDLESFPSKCESFYILPDLPHGQFSNVKTKRILGFRPRDNFEKIWTKKA